ncbi:MAG: amidohydrolase family protein [Vicinamibacterales bacterium]
MALRLFPSAGVALVLTLGSALTERGAAQTPTLAITNVTVIDGTDAPPTVANVIVREGLVRRVTTAPAPAGSTIVNGTGKFLIPGLWDMHVHLATRPEPELAEKTLMPMFLSHGVVGVRDMGGPLERVVALRDRAERGELAGPRVITPGPFVDGAGEAGPMFRRAVKTADATTYVDELSAAGVDFIKVQAGLEPDVHAAVISAARRKGLQVVGHIPMSMTAEPVIAAGQRSIEHVSPALVGDGMLLFSLSSKSAELLKELRDLEAARATTPASAIAAREAALRRQLVTTYDPARARALGRSLHGKAVWLVPTLVWSRNLRPTARTEDGTGLPWNLVPVATKDRWLARRAQYLKTASDDDLKAAADVAAVASRAVGDLHAAGAAILAGTDTFDAFVLPGASLHEELRLLVEAGLTPLQALQAATRDAAAFRGASRMEGTIALGRRADLVLLTANPLRAITNIAQVEKVWIAGNQAFSR